MRSRPPLLYDLIPTELDEGERWLELRLKNAGSERLTSLEVQLNSRDPYGIRVPGPGMRMEALKPGQEERLQFKVSVRASGRLHAAIDGWRIEEPLDERPFHWESGEFFLSVSRSPADLVNLFALTAPYPPRGQSFACEALLRGVAGGTGLTLEFIADLPSGSSEVLETVQPGALAPGEEARYTAEITPREAGLHAIHAYLTADGRRLGHEIEYVHVLEQKEAHGAAPDGREDPSKENSKDENGGRNL